MSLIGSVQGWVKDHVQGLVSRLEAVEHRLEAVERYIRSIEQSDSIPENPAPRVVSAPAKARTARGATGKTSA